MLRKLATRLGQNKHRAWRSGIASAETDEAPPIACCHGHRGMTWMAGCGSHPSSNRNRSAARYFRRFVPIASADAHERYWLGGILTAVRGLVTPKTVYNRREFTHRRLLGTQAPRHVGGAQYPPMYATNIEDTGTRLLDTSGKIRAAPQAVGHKKTGG